MGETEYVVHLGGEWLRGGASGIVKRRTAHRACACVRAHVRPLSRLSLSLSHRKVLFGMDLLKSRSWGWFFFLRSLSHLSLSLVSRLSSLGFCVCSCCGFTE